MKELCKDQRKSEALIVGVVEKSGRKEVKGAFGQKEINVRLKRVAAMHFFLTSLLCMARIL